MARNGFFFSFFGFAHSYFPIEIEAANADLAKNDATSRTRKNMQATLEKKFSVAIRDFQEAQTQAKMSYEGERVLPVVWSSN